MRSKGMLGIYGRIVSLLALGLCLSLTSAICPNLCNGVGTCDIYDRCICNRGVDGEPLYIGSDCSLRTCPKGVAWVGDVVSSNNVHPLAECSNKGICNRKTGACMCFENYEGLACERNICPKDCSDQGECYTQKQLADEAGRIYSTPWDSNKQTGCVCDAGFRGYDCSLIECPSGPDPLLGAGNEAGRECSGRGICRFDRGVCDCFIGFGGLKCNKMLEVIIQ
jgi:hypothetical protein